MTTQAQIWPLGTKSVYERAGEDGVRILVTRFWPRGKPKSDYATWYKDLAPTEQLLSDYQTGKLGWHGFSQAYQIQMRDSLPARMNIWGIEKALIMGKAITLLCFEDEKDFCHRHILKEIILEELHKQ